MDYILRSEEKAIFKLRNLYESYGYRPFKMSRFEEYDLYTRNKDFLVSDSIITFTDTNGVLMALKPDVTLSIIKDSTDITGSVKKVYYNENVYRVSKGTQSFKEIVQTGLECLGDVDEYIICEKSAKQLQEASDYLTEQVRLYAMTGETQYRDNYFEEVKVTRRREHALDSLISSR